MKKSVLQKRSFDEYSEGNHCLLSSSNSEELLRYCKKIKASTHFIPRNYSQLDDIQYSLHKVRQLIYRGNYTEAAQILHFGLSKLNEYSSQTALIYEYDVVAVTLAHKSAFPDKHASAVHCIEEFGKLINVLQNGCLPPLGMIGELSKQLVQLNDWIFIREYFKELTKVATKPDGTQWNSIDFF